MAGASLLSLLDDIASLLDDVALMSKTATQKTAGVLGDDLAVNAEQVSGVRANRELPVVWAVAKGSFKNKCILVPAALIISALVPWLITPLLMLGGIYLCHEGFEKVCHGLWRKKSTHAATHIGAQTLSESELRQFEQTKIKGAIRTDMVLSAEIIVIALGTVQSASLAMQATVIACVAIAITIAVYGLVAAIVKMDDAGIYLLKYQPLLGKGLIAFSPILMRSLTLVGTVAMFLVGGGIIMHGLPFIAHELLALSSGISHYLSAGIITLLLNLFVGIALGAITLALFKLWLSIKPQG